MVKFLILLLMLLGGMGMGAQASINSELGKRTGVIETALISFFVGTLVLLLLTLFIGKGNIFQVVDAPKWQLFGGILGAIYVFLVAFSVPKIGTASAVYAAIAGQMVVTMVIDNYGLFGAPQISFGWMRLLGMILIGAGLYFIFQSSVNH